MSLDELAKVILHNKNPEFDYKLAAELLAAKSQVLLFHHHELEHEVQQLALKINNS